MVEKDETQGLIHDWAKPKTQPEDGQVAYEAYREACPVSKFTGDKLPPWSEIDPDLKPYWKSVEEAVIDRTLDMANERRHETEKAVACAHSRRADAEERKAEAAERQAEAMMCIGKALREFGIEFAGLLAMARDGEENVDIEALRRRFDGGA